MQHTPKGEVTLCTRLPFGCRDELRSFWLCALCLAPFWNFLWQFDLKVCGEHNQFSNLARLVFQLTIRACDVVRHKNFDHTVIVLSGTERNVIN